MIDFDELIEQLTRREWALNTGSSHIPRDQRANAGPRGDAESPLDRPELRWPSQRHQAPTRCHHCGAGGANLLTDPPHGTVKHGETTCLLCGRVSVRWRAERTRPIAGRTA